MGEISYKKKQQIVIENSLVKKSVEVKRRHDKMELIGIDDEFLMISSRVELLLFFLICGTTTPPPP